MEFDSEVEEGEGWDDSKAETDAPGGAKMVFTGYEDLRNSKI